MPGRPTRREILCVSAAALAVVAGGIVAATLAVRATPAPTYKTDAPAALASLASGGELRGWHTTGHALFARSQILANPTLVPDATVLRVERACAFLDGPTAPYQVTAVAASELTTGSGDGQSQLFSEAITYASPDPVATDVADAERPGLDSCVSRLLAADASAAHVRSTADLHPTSVGGGLGDAHAIAVAGTWLTFFPAPFAVNQHGSIPIEVVLLTSSRGEVVVVAESVSPALVQRVVRSSARALESRLS